MPHLLRTSSLAALLAFAVAALVGCNNPSTSNGVMTVYVLGDHGKSSFNPGNFNVELGTIVTWVNQDTVPHTVTAPGVFDSGPIPPNGGRWSWGASVVGTYTYHCLIHPDMNGTVVVTAPTPTGY